MVNGEVSDEFTKIKPVIELSLDPGGNFPCILCKYTPNNHFFL